MTLLLDQLTAGDMRKFVAELDRLQIEDSEMIEQDSEPFDGLMLRVEHQTA